VSTGGGTRAIIAALGANLGIAVAKLTGFVVTGSSSMLAESVHSLADSGNQALLLLGRHRARRAADEEHPFGYGRDRYFYAFVVALVIFALGSLFAFYEGLHKLAHPAELEAPVVALVILAVAIGLEGFSFRTAVGEARRLRGGASWFAYIRRAKAPELPVVLLEDLAALLGLVFALVGVGLTALTGDGRWDAAGTLAIAVLLGVVATVLVIETKSLLIGEGAAPDVVRQIRAALPGPGIERVIHLRTLHLGPEELLVAAKVAMPAVVGLGQVAQAIDDAELRIRAAVPTARLIYLEPDLDRGMVPEPLDPAAEPLG
jgi:cation diffusion facilitator family transporter